MFTPYTKIQDSTFLKKLDEYPNKKFYIEVVVLDIDEKPIESIEGKISAGNINIDGKSSVRRTCNLTFVCSDITRTYDEIRTLLSINRRIKIIVGLENLVEPDYGNIIGFPQGIFIINQITCNHAIGGTTISISAKDKMCLLNGDCGGILPSTVELAKYTQTYSIVSISSENDLPDPSESEASPYIIYKYKKNGSTVYKLYSAELREKDPTANYIEWYQTVNPKSSPYSTGVEIKTPIYDIIKTLVGYYGNEASNKIFIKDIDLKVKQTSRWANASAPLYFNPNTNEYSLTIDDTLKNTCITYTYNDNVGYTYIPFVYPDDELTTGIGDNITTILDKIVKVLGNYEYFYDIEGNFIFQEKPNYLNTSYEEVQKNRLDVITGEFIEINGNIVYNNPSSFFDGYVDSYTQTFYFSDDSSIKVNKKLKTLTLTLSTTANNSSLLDMDNYYINFATSSASVYSFLEGNNLVSSYSNTPNYANIKNDFHVWGKTKTSNAVSESIHYHLAVKEKPYIMNTYLIEYDEDNEGKIKLSTATKTKVPKWQSIEDEDDIISNADYLELSEEDQANYTATGGVYSYTPEDWRAELYLQGLTEQREGKQPDIFKQELLNFFDNIYNFKEKSFKEDFLKTPNEFNYWFDYLEPVNGLEDYSVDSIGIRTKTSQSDSINALFSTEVPEVMIISEDSSTDNEEAINYCIAAQEPYTRVPSTIFDHIIANVVGTNAQDEARDMIYQYLTSSQSISITTTPIYYLEPNTRITVKDQGANIAGDFIISTISVPLDSKSSMTISATKALERV